MMFNLPADWEDDERMAFLFRDFRPREANPLGFDEKMLFWKKLVTSFTRQRCKAIFNVQLLAESFTRKNSQPVCLSRVIDALRQEGVIQLRNRQSWLGWVSSWFFSPPTPAEDEWFFNVQAVDEARQDAQTAIKAAAFRDTRVALRDVWNVCRDACGGSQELFHLVLERLPGVSVRDNVVEFATGSDLIRSLTEHEKALVKVRETRPRIEQKIDLFQTKEEMHKANAVRLKKEGQTSKALGELRRAKVAEKQVEKLNRILDNLHSMESDLENQGYLPAILESYKLATVALKTVNSEADKVQEIVDEMADAAAEQQEIQESVATGATTFAPGQDTDEDLEKELQKILQEEKAGGEAETLPVFPSVPDEPLGDAEKHIAKKRVRLGYFE